MAEPQVHRIVIEPETGLPSLRLGELWAYRELLFFLVWRDVKIRYKQTLLGAAWAIIQPVLTMVVFTIFFGRIAQLGPEGVPYPIFSYIALLPWTFFAGGLAAASNSLVGSANLIKKVYFPRLFVPTAGIFAGLVDFLLAFSVLLVMLWYYATLPNLWALALPLFLLLAIMTALGTGLWLSALNVEYRDIRFIVPFFVQLWLFVTPVIYPLSRVIEMFENRGLPSWLYGLNPMVSVVQGFRRAFFEDQVLPTGILATSVTVAIVLIVSGLFYFRKMEKRFADVA